MRYLIVVLIFMISVVMVIFGALNTQKVELNLLVYNAREVSLSLVVVLAALGGVILSGLVSLWNSITQGFRERAIRRRLERENRDLMQRLAIAERDNKTLRGALGAASRQTGSLTSGDTKPPIK